MIKNHEVEQPYRQDRMEYIQLGDMEPGIQYHFQYQTFRNRIIYTTPAPEYKVVAVEFLEDVMKDGSHISLKADLRDLVLEGTGITEDDLVAMLEDSGRETIRSQPRYHQSKLLSVPEIDILGVNPTDPRQQIQLRPKTNPPAVK